MLRLTLILVFVLLGTGTSVARDFSDFETIRALEQKIPQVMQEENTPGLSIALIRNNRVVWTKGFGVIRNGEPEKITTDTIFEAASMSKPVFAYLALQLVDQEKLLLNRPLDDYLPKPYIPHEPLAATITARMALSHTTGLQNWRKGKPFKLHFTPGTDWKYSGEGYKYLQRVVEQITGVHLGIYADKELFNKLQLVKTSYTWEKTFANNFAQGHDESGEIIEDKKLYKKPNAAYTLYTSPTEYSRFILHIMNNSSNPSLLHETYRLYTQDQKLPGKKTRPRSLGWRIKETDRFTYLYHGGSNKGFKCYSRFDIDRKKGVVIMTNASNGKKTYQKILKEIDRLEEKGQKSTEESTPELLKWLQDAIGF